jgi:hypothetical protein
MTHVIDVSGFARVIWENPRNLEFIVGRRGKSPNLFDVVVNRDPGHGSQNIYRLPEDSEINSKDAGVSFLRDLLEQILAAIPADHKGRDDIMTQHHLERIMREVREKGSSSTYLWGATETAPAGS